MDGYDHSADLIGQSSFVAGKSTSAAVVVRPQMSELLQNLMTKQIRVVLPTNLNINEDLKNFIASLLDVNFITRLGTGTNGTRNVKEHALFGQVNWFSVEKKTNNPPFIPKSGIQQPVKLISAVGDALSRITNKLPFLSTRSSASGVVVPISALGTSTVLDTAQSRWGQMFAQMEQEEQEFEFNFEKLLSYMGKEDWLPSPMRMVATISIGKTYYSANMKLQMFKKWKCISKGAMLAEVGFEEPKTTANSPNASTIAISQVKR